VCLRECPLVDVEGGAHCWSDDDGGTRTRRINLSRVILSRSHRIPTIGTNYVGGCGYDGCGDGDVGSDESDGGSQERWYLVDREK
jgi:hypothetical protein